jgi:hypothetical protein
VTSNRSRFHPASSDAIAAAVPARACQLSSARSEPGEAGWLTQGILTGAPTIRATAHSMCEQSAGGAE